MHNFIRDTNPFNLAGPPKWFLTQLLEFDPSLVIVPSRQGFYYRLAQRRKLMLTEKVVNEALFAESDTKMLAAHSLVPVTTILANPNWGNPILFEELKKRAPWRMGGAQKAIQMVEDQEWAGEMAKRAKTEEHVTHMAKESWLYYNKKTGNRTDAWRMKAAKGPTAAPVAPGLIRVDAPKPYQPLITTGFSSR